MYILDKQEKIDPRETYSFCWAMGNSAALE